MCLARRPYPTRTFTATNTGTPQKNDPGMRTRTPRGESVQSEEISAKTTILYRNTLVKESETELVLTVVNWLAQRQSSNFVGSKTKS